MVVVVNQANRGPGLVDSGTQNLAAVLGSAPVPGTVYIGTLILDAADRDDPALVFGQMALSIDGQVVWGPTDCPCGAKDRNGNPIVPSLAWGNSGFGATTCRVTFNASRRVRVGLDVSTQPMVR
jgi:hypothetical protein